MRTRIDYQIGHSSIWQWSHKACPKNSELHPRVVDMPILFSNQGSIFYTNWGWSFKQLSTELSHLFRQLIQIVRWNCFALLWRHINWIHRPFIKARGKVIKTFLISIKFILAHQILTKLLVLGIEKHLSESLILASRPCRSFAFR